MKYLPNIMKGGVPLCRRLVMFRNSNYNAHQTICMYHYNIIIKT